MKTCDYEAFIERKTRTAPAVGFNSAVDTDHLFAFQRDVTRWALRRGRAAIFAATGLGKTRMEIEWARHVAEHVGGPVLILAPLAVAPQIVREGAAMGVTVRHCHDGLEVADTGLAVTNYDRLHRFDAARFAGVVMDESSCIKNFTSKTLQTMLDAFGATPYRLSATATPAPNDYTEIGTQAEFLGVATRSEMLAEYFCHDGGETQTWRLKGHAREVFWEWVASWAALIRRPSDLGYEDDEYELPTLNICEHIIPACQDDVFAMGRLFAPEAGDLTERRAARRVSIPQRVERCAAIVNAEPDEPWIVWGDLNAETEGLTRAIPGAVEVRGSQSITEKEAALIAFAEGRIRVLVSKPSICGWGLNWQHCARMAFVGVSDSWESYHQAIRRIWRFHQHRPVTVHLVLSEMESSVLANLKRKEQDAAQMGEELAAMTARMVRAQLGTGMRERAVYAAATPLRLPEWVTA